jgi:hypothetical protein
MVWVHLDKEENKCLVCLVLEMNFRFSKIQEIFDLVSNYEFVRRNLLCVVS